MAKNVKSVTKANPLRGSVAKPTVTLGRPGYSVYGGYITSNERAAELSDDRKYITFSNILANCSIVASSLRYFLAIVGSASWSIKPSEQDIDGKFSDLVRQILMEDPETPWHRIVRRASMYRFYGFSVAEWTARRQGGVVTLADVAPRPQSTLERWDTDANGHVLGIYQVDPQTYNEIYLPRAKLLYVVDDTIDDNPQGAGVLRHVVEAAKRLQRYTQLEGFGFETDLRGVPVGKAPYGLLRQQVASGNLSAADARQALDTVETFIRKHIRNPELGLVLDSAVYTSSDEAGTPSGNSLYGMEILTSASNGLTDVANAISRINHEIARIMGTEHLLLGSDSAGSFALSKNKTEMFTMNINGVLKELAESFKRDLIHPVWALNGWPIDMMPSIAPEDVTFKDVEAVTAALRDMAQAGAVIAPDDEVINDVRALLGLSMAKLDDVSLSQDFLDKIGGDA